MSVGALPFYGVCQNEDSLANTKDTLPINYFKPTVYPVLFGKQSESRLVQSVGFLRGRETEKSPVSLVTNALQGRMAGLHSLQKTGIPRYDNPDISLRGRSPLIVVDGIPRYALVDEGNDPLFDVLSLNPEQIESVSLLKDGLSTAMFGNRGMDGVLMVTTKKKSDEPYNYILLKAQTGVQSPLGLRKTASAGDYVKLYNEALANDGRPPLFSQAQVDSFSTGTDRFLYPNVNWYDEILNKTARLDRYTINAAGSSRTLDYFVSLDYQNQDGFFKEDPANAYGTNINYKRYNIRSNLGIRIDKNLSAFLNVFATIQDYISPGGGTNTVMSGALTTPNNAYPRLNFEGSYGGNISYRNNVWAKSTGSGYFKNNLQAGSFDVGFKRNMNDVLKGLWVKALLSYSPSYEQELIRTKTFDFYQFPVTGDTANFRRFGLKSEQLNDADVEARMQQAYTEVSVGYDKGLGQHLLSGILLGNYESVQVNNLLNQIVKGFATRWNYSYDNRYNLEFAAAYNGNNRFAPGNQYNFFPSGGISWNVHKESFFGSEGVIDFLKLRVTYGKVGNANPGYYEFMQNYMASTGYFFGPTGSSAAGVRQADLANPNRVTEKALKFNAGVDLKMLDNRAWITADFYNNHQYDLLQIRGHNSGILGQEYPLENIGVNKYYGVEVSAGWTEQVKSFRYFIDANLAVQQSRNIDIDEVTQPYEWMRLTGRPVSQLRGYVAEGLFSASNLNEATIEGYRPMAGDIKYRDLNGDGVINTLDRTVIGNDKPLLFYGANLGLMFKGFDLSVLLQGVKNRDILTTGDYVWEFQDNGRGQLFEPNLDRYTPSSTDASYPRLSIGTNRNNHIASSFWVKNGNYFRLKNFEVGYAFDSRFLSKISVRQVRLFVNGQNLFTVSSFKESDPEVYAGQYPIAKTINGGISIKL